MEKILRLDLSGMPTAWLTREDAAMLYAKEQVVWELGEQTAIMIGGITRAGLRSSLKLSPVIATQGNMGNQPRRTRTLSNTALFRRDNHHCLYCGSVFGRAQLTRDHVVPRAQGGKDVWENVVAACRRCNHAKADKTPEQAHMPLLAVPFRPNLYEAMFLANRRIIGDQMDYLEKQFSGKRDWSIAA